MSVMPEGNGSFGDIEKAARVYAINELTPVMEALKVVNKWIGEEVIRSPLMRCFPQRNNRQKIQFIWRKSWTYNEPAFWLASSLLHKISYSAPLRIAAYSLHEESMSPPKTTAHRGAETVILRILPPSLPKPVYGGFPPSPTRNEHACFCAQANSPPHTADSATIDQKDNLLFGSFLCSIA